MEKKYYYTMEKELLSYKEALALKKLGFNELCFAVIFKEDGHIVYDQCANKSEFLKRKWRRDREEDYVITTLTYRQAFNFFREKYGLHSWVGIGVHEYCYRIYDHKKGKSLIDVREEFNGTFEEAELECLKKLIKFAIKNKIQK